jgi:hypothetical protein
MDLEYLARSREVRCAEAIAHWKAPKINKPSPKIAGNETWQYFLSLQHLGLI